MFPESEKTTVPGERLGADRGVPLGAVLDDRRDGGDRLHVVDQRRRAVQAADRGERRTRARLAAVPLERLEQRRLLAADVRAGAAMQDDGHVLEQPGRARLLERAPHDLEHVQVLAAQVDEDVLRLDPVGGDEAALDQPVGVLQHDLAVLERPRLGLVRVHAQVGRLARPLGEEARLAAHGEARPAAAAQVRVHELLDDLRRLHAPGLAQRLVAADRLVLGELRQVALVRVRECDLVNSHRAPPPRSAGRPRA